MYLTIYKCGVLDEVSILTSWNCVGKYKKSNGYNGGGLSVAIEYIMVSP